MSKIAFIGAGSTVFAKNVLGDCLLSDGLHDAHLALYDIDGERLEQTKNVMHRINDQQNDGRASISTHCGLHQRREALTNADAVVFAFRVGGYRPSTVIDFEVPKKHGLRHTIADSYGLGGIFRALRSIPVLVDTAREMEEVCPKAMVLNYTNPMAMNTASILQGTSMRAVGLCHSVQGCARQLLMHAGMWDQVKNLRWRVAGINHQAWLLDIRDGEQDLYPEIKRRIFEQVEAVYAAGGGKAYLEELEQKAEAQGKPLDECFGREAGIAKNLVRYEFLRRFGYYVTESSEHNAEYCSWFIKPNRPELIDRYNIPLDEYIRRCERNEKRWANEGKLLFSDDAPEHKKSHEYGSAILAALITGHPARIHGNVMNDGLIDNLPRNACVEVACLCDENGVQPTRVGSLPEVCAGLNRMHATVQALTVQAALERRRDLVYQAAMLDPHTGGTLTIDEIVALCDDMFEAHGDYIPQMR